MRILIATGGTGGHLYPAIVLARELKKRGCEVLFVLKANETSPKEILSDQFASVPVAGAPFDRSNPLRNLSGAFSNFKGLFQGLRVIGTFKPDIAVGFGGYASVAVVLASAIKGIPIIIHEQNVVPGFANKVCAVFARRVAVSFKETLGAFPKKGVLVGNLIREDLFSLDRAAAFKSLGLKEGRKTILVFGGSAGSRSINKAVLRCLGPLKDLSNNLQFVHQTGHPDETAALKERYQEYGFHALVRDYFPEMSLCYSACDLVVARAGAGAVSELAATRNPAILIPYAHAAGNHQMKNAETLAGIGAAKVLEESENIHVQLSNLIRDMITSPRILDQMRENVRRFQAPLKEAPQKLAELIFAIQKQ